MVLPDVIKQTFTYLHINVLKNILREEIYTDYVIKNK